MEYDICVDEGILKGIRCSCLKLQSLRTPCSHIFFVLGVTASRLLCFEKVDKGRGGWGRGGGKSAFPPIRKSSTYDYMDSLQKYRELCNIGHTASFVYERLKRVLEEEAAMILPNGVENRGKRYGLVLLQALDVDSTESKDVLDPMYVPSRGSNKNKAKRKCTLCKGEGHNR